MKKQGLPLLLLLFGWHSLAEAQEIPAATRQQLESLAETTEEEIDDDAALQQFAYWRREPLNLNEAEAADLRFFPFLTDLQVQHFLQHRKLLGNLIDVHELQSIPSWDVETIRKLLPFVRVAQPFTIRESLLGRFAGGDAWALLRCTRVVQKAKGYSRTNGSGFLGDANHLLFRYRYQYKNLLQYGLTADKDAGEPFWKGPSKGFDFYSAHLFARNLGLVKALALGDFTVNLGQGLVHWQSLAFHKSAEVLSVKRQSPVLKPYTSAGEFNFLRGAGLTVGKGSWEATAFASHRKRDAGHTINEEGSEVITSFLSSGLHRTASELASRKWAVQQTAGGGLSFRKNRLYLGINGVYYRFSQAVEKRPEPYNLFAVRGDRWVNISADYSYTYKNMHFFGEAALDKRGQGALANGVLVSAHPKVDLCLLHRKIAAGYAAVSGNAFTESASPANESGVYLGLRLRLRPQLTLSAYSDVYSFPWLKYRADAPGYGTDCLLQLEFRPNKQVEVYTRFRTETKTANRSADSAATNYLAPIVRQSWRLHLSCQLSRHWQLRSRAEAVWHDKKGQDTEEGFLLYVEGLYQSRRKLGGSFRLAVFETGSYDSRLYTYESDVLYSNSIPAFFDKGVRTYININYDVTKKASVWLRCAQTMYRQKDEIGSGLDAVEGNMRTEVKLQVLLRF